MYCLNRRKAKSVARPRTPDPGHWPNSREVERPGPALASRGRAPHQTRSHDPGLQTLADPPSGQSPVARVKSLWFFLDATNKRRDDARDEIRGSPEDRARTDDRPPDGPTLWSSGEPEGRRRIEYSPYPVFTPAPEVSCGTPGDGCTPLPSRLVGPGDPCTEKPGQWPGFSSVRRAACLSRGCSSRCGLPAPSSTRWRSSGCTSLSPRPAWLASARRRASEGSRPAAPP